MGNKTVSWLQPDKIIKDLLWDDLTEAATYAHGAMLDVGAGKMPYKDLFIQKIKRYVSIDKYTSHADIQEDFLAKKFPLNSFDTILCTQVLEHVPEPEAVLDKCYRILRKNGVMILTVPFIGSLHEVPYDYYRFTEYSLRHLCEKVGFSVVYIKGQGNWISSVATLFTFYLESTYNRYLLRYPKKILNAGILFAAYLTSFLPERIIKARNCPMNYICVVRKA